MRARHSLPIHLAAVALCTILACSDEPTTPSPVLKVTVVGGTSGQEAQPGTTLPRPLTVSVTLGGAPAPGVTVTWAASTGTLGRTSAVTGGDGQATSAWTLGTETGIQTAVASVDGAQGSPVTFTARALERPAEPPAGAIFLRLTPGSRLLDVKEFATFDAELLYADGNTGPAALTAWFSSDPAVVVVAGPGRVQAVAPGHALVHASAEGLTATADITVLGPVVSVSVVPDPPAILVGDDVRWRVEARDAAGTVYASPIALWTSSAPGVAFVQANGRILGISPGPATISATIEGITASAELTVLAPLDVGGGWTMEESLTMDSYPTSQTCALSGPVTLNQADASVAIGGTYERAGVCPYYGGGSLDLNGAAVLEGSIAGSVVELESHTVVDCSYRGTVDRVTWNRITGSVYCAGRPGTPQELQEWYGTFRLSR
jgi:hypothetical protein